MPRGLGVRNQDVKLARGRPPRQVAAATLTPASLIAAATGASAPGLFSISITKSTAMALVAHPYVETARW